MQKTHLTHRDMGEVWQLIHEAFTTNARDYQAQWVPYLSQFERHWRRALTTCTSMRELEQAIEIAPFARFGLSLSLQYPDHDQLVAVFSNLAMAHVCELDLYGATIQSKQAQLLAQCEALDHLIWLELTGCWLDVSCCEVLCQGEHFGALRVLRAADGDIQNEGLSHLAHARNMPALTTLSIANNAIDDEGLAALVESPLFSRLVALDLGHNAITDHGVARLLDALPASQLKALGLFETEVDLDLLPKPLQEILANEYVLSAWMFPFGERY